MSSKNLPLQAKHLTRDPCPMASCGTAQIYMPLRLTTPISCQGTSDNLQVGSDWAWDLLIRMTAE